MRAALSSMSPSSARSTPLSCVNGGWLGGGSATTGFAPPDLCRAPFHTSARCTFRPIQDEHPSVCIAFPAARLASALGSSSTSSLSRPTSSHSRISGISRLHTTPSATSASPSVHRHQHHTPSRSRESSPSRAGARLRALMPRVDYVLVEVSDTNLRAVISPALDDLPVMKAGLPSGRFTAPVAKRPPSRADRKRTRTSFDGC